MKIVLIFFLLFLSFLLAQPKDSLSEQDKILVEKDSDGEVRLSFFIKTSSIFSTLYSLSQRLGYEVFLAEELRSELEKKYLPVHIKERSVPESLELLTKAVGCSYHVQEKKLLVYKENLDSREEKEIITGYKRLLFQKISNKESKENQEQTALIYFSLGVFFYLQKKPEMSFAELDALAQLFPQSEIMPYNLLLMAKNAMASQDYKKAQAVLSRYFQDFSRHEFAEKAFFELAECYEKQNNLEQTKRIYEYILNHEKSKAKGKACWLLGKIFYKEKNYDKACAFFEKAWDTISEGSIQKPQILLDYIQCLIDQGQKQIVEKKIGLFYKNFFTHPLSERVRFYHAILCKEKKEFWQAYCLLKPLLSSPKKKVRISASLEVVPLLKELEMIPFAIEIAEKILPDIGHSSFREKEILYELGVLYQKQGDWEKAKQIFGKLSERFLTLNFTLLQSSIKDPKVGQEWERLEELKKEYQNLQKKNEKEIFNLKERQEKIEEDQYSLAKNQEKQGEIEKAIEIYEKISKGNNPNFLIEQCLWNIKFLKWKKETQKKLASLSAQESFMKTIPAKKMLPKETVVPEKKEETPLEEIKENDTNENPKKKPKASEPEWLLTLISHVEKMDKLFPTIKISDANMAIEIARVQNYFSVVKNYPSEILVLVQKLRKRISSGKSIKSFLEKEFFQTKTPEKHFLLLDSFVKTKVFPIEEKYISEITKLLKEKTIDQNALQKIRQCFERIHEQFEENHRLIGHALAEWEAKE